MCQLIPIGRKHLSMSLSSNIMRGGAQDRARHHGHAVDNINITPKIKEKKTKDLIERLN